MGRCCIFSAVISIHINVSLACFQLPLAVRTVFWGTICRPQIARCRVFLSFIIITDVIPAALIWSKGGNGHRICCACQCLFDIPYIADGVEINCSCIILSLIKIKVANRSCRKIPEGKSIVLIMHIRNTRIIPHGDTVINRSRDICIQTTLCDQIPAFHAFRHCVFQKLLIFCKCNILSRKPLLCIILNSVNFKVRRTFQISILAAVHIQGIGAFLQLVIDTPGFASILSGKIPPELVAVWIFQILVFIVPFNINLFLCSIGVFCPKIKVNTLFIFCILQIIGIQKLSTNRTGDGNTA